MDGNADLTTIVRSTIELGHSLGLKVVAEGVEDPEAFALLRELRCDSAQGYYMSPPLPPDDFRAWLNGTLPGPKNLEPQTESVLGNSLADTARVAGAK